MNIVVCVKYVPDTASLKMNADNTINWDSMEYIINPYDEYAVETAIRLKETKEGTTITALTVGPESSKEALKKALAMGCDSAHHLSDDAFNEVDPSATARVLAAGIQKLVPDYSLVIFGQSALDDNSGITGPQVAEYLNIPSLTFLKNAELKDDNTLTLQRETPEHGVETYDMTLPGAIIMMKCEYEPRMPSIKGVMKANRTPIEALDAGGLGLSSEQTGSPTTVLEKAPKPAKTGGQKIDGSNPQDAADQLIAYLEAQKVL